MFCVTDVSRLTLRDNFPVCAHVCVLVRVNTCQPAWLSHTFRAGLVVQVTHLFPGTLLFTVIFMITSYLGYERLDKIIEHLDCSETMVLTVFSVTVDDICTTDAQPNGSRTRVPHKCS